MKYASFLVFAIVMLLVVFGCTTSPIYDVNDESFGLINNETWLYNSEVDTSGEELTSTKAWGDFDVSLSKSIFLMYKVAHINSPTLDGQTLQATDVAIAGDSNQSYAYVTYAMAGSSFYGGMDILKLTKGYFPKINSRLLTKKEDANSVTYDSVTNRIFLGLHVNPDIYGLDPLKGYYGAYLRSVELDSSNKVKLSDGSLVTQGVELQSYAANDAAIMDSKVLVPVGAIGGGVERRDTADIITGDSFINTLKGSNLNDTRAVATYNDINGNMAGFLVYQGPDNATPTLYKCGTDGSYIDYLFITNPLPLTNESKSTIEVHGNVAFVAASDGGVHVINIDNMTELFNIPNPTSVEYKVYGLSDDLVTANDVTVSKLESATNESVIFIANGEYGVRAFELNFDIDSVSDVAAKFASNYTGDYDSTTTGSNYVGNVHLGNGDSANSLLYRNGYLFVGTGLGGLNVLYVVDKDASIPHWVKPSLK